MDGFHLANRIYRCHKDENQTYDGDEGSHHDRSDESTDFQLFQVPGNDPIHKDNYIRRKQMHYVNLGIWQLMRSMKL